MKLLTEKLKTGAKTLFKQVTCYFGRFKEIISRFSFTNQKPVISLGTLFLIISIIFLNSHGLTAATYTWSQSDWGGGTSGGSYPAHPGDQSGWTKYESKDGSTSIGSGNISVTATASTSGQTTYAQFFGGTFSTATTTSAGANVTLLASALGDAWSSAASRADTATYLGGITKGPNGYLYAYYKNGSSQEFFQRYSSSTNSWSSMATLGSTDYGSMSWGGANKIFIFRQGGTNQKNEYSVSGNSWSSAVSTPGSLGDGSDSAYPGTGDYVYVSSGSATPFYRYSITGNSFSTMTAMTASNGAGSALVSTGNDYLYLTRGGNTTTFYRYSISGNSWSTMTSVPASVSTGGSMVYPDTGDYIYVTPTGSTLYRYSITGDSWTQMTSPPASLSNSRGSDLAYPGVGNYFYALVGGDTTTYRYAMNSTYPTSGTFTSSSIDLGQQSIPTTLAWTATTPTNTTVRFQLRSASSAGALTSATYYGPTSTSDFYTTSTSTINSIHNGHRYFQYKAYLDTTDTSVTPTVSDVNINYSFYPATSTLTSSAFNSADSHNVLAKIQWTATTPTNTAVKFQLRSAPNSAGAPGTYTSFMGPDGTSGTYFTDSAGGQSLPSALTDGANDQWFQYKVFLTNTDTSVAPTLSDVTTTYVVNAPPDFNTDYPSSGNGGVGATENADGTVTINYSVRDADTATGATPNLITPSFEYSLNNGSNWSSISSGNLAVGDTSTKSVDGVNYTVHTATWNAVGNVPDTYASQVKIRVTANDSEAANNTATAVSQAFVLDTKTPTLGGTPIFVDESQSPAVVTLSATDDSVLQMKVGKTSDLSDATYEAYAGTKTLSVSSGETVYAQFLDAYGNASTIVSAVPPVAPSNMFFQDVSNSDLSDWRIFFAWSVVPNPTAGFRRYNIYRSVDGGGYSLLSTVTTRAQNYYVDTSLVTTSNYSYKITAEDNNGNISFFSPSVSHTPNGVGGSDITPPTITSVSSSQITTTGATITWTTDKLSNSTVYYSQSATSPGTDKSSYAHSVGVPSMVTDHSVTLSGLDPNSPYYFLVESTDASNNIADLTDVDTYTFNTARGPVISNVTAPSLFDTEATITWNTDLASDSYVTYSLNPDLSSPIGTVGSASLVSAHSVTLTGLTRGTKYYYYVSSTDDQSYTATDKNVVDGVITYFNFVTTNDPVAPTITNVATSLVGEAGVAITWTTNKPALSQVAWGITNGLGATTTEGTTYTFDHAVILNNLSTTTQYYYQVISRDKNDNTASSSINTFTTLAPTVVTNTVTEIVTVGGGGGGGGIIDNRDLTVPKITDVQVVQIGARSAVITFTSSKITNSLVNYGKTIQYGTTVGDAKVYMTSHRVVLVGLAPKTQYHFKAQGDDVFGNKGYSSDMTFTTLASSDSDVQIVNSTGELSPEELSILDKVKGASPIFVEKLLESLSQDSNLLNVTNDSLTSFISDFASKIGNSPAISGPDVAVEVGSRTAIIRWTTDKPSNSLIAYAKSDEYKPDSDSPYSISAGHPDDSVTEHSVTLSNLEPNTTYHFSARSQGPIGPVSVSGDKTFQTTALFPAISNLRFDDINETSATLSWETDVPTKTTITLTNTKTGYATSTKETAYAKEHTFVVPKLDIANPYTVSILATDSDGNVSKPSVLPFTTVLSREAPKISRVRISTALIPDKAQTAQSIISWKTDKPATSKVWFGEGSVTELKQSTETNDALVTDHIVVTTLLKPGTAYTLKVESGDSAGNISQSDRYSVLTPKVAGSVVDLIFGNFNKTFGFLRK